MMCCRCGQRDAVVIWRGYLLCSFCALLRIGEVPAIEYAAGERAS